MSEEDAEVRMRGWVERAVVGLDLCPFARRVVRAEGLRYVTVPTADVATILAAVHEELMELALPAPGSTVETTLVLVPGLAGFERFVAVMARVEALLPRLELRGVIQVAHFHPDYRFAGVPADAPGNATNQAPVPAFHLLREADVAAAVAAHPDPEGIPRRNIARLEALDAEARRRLRDG
ncbi:MAG: DUF1415 domain-containing protein [Myxococcales bacterium]|nr:DUF1415 domain-containing protein [Myxococcales bacterium]